MPLVDDHEPTGEGSVDQVVLAAGRWGQLGQSRVDRTTVVTLRIVLKEELPVGMNVVLYGASYRELGEVEASEPTDQPLESFGKRLRILRQVDEDEALPAFNRHPVQGIVAL